MEQGVSATIPKSMMPFGDRCCRFLTRDWLRSEKIRALLLKTGVDIERVSFCVFPDASDIDESPHPHVENEGNGQIIRQK